MTMKNKLIILFILLSNFYFIYDNIRLKNKINESLNSPADLSINNSLLRLNSVTVKDWITNNIISLKSDSFCFIFFFSKYNCDECIKSVNSYLASKLKPNSNYYLVSIDIDDYDYLKKKV